MFGFRRVARGPWMVDGREFFCSGSMAVAPAFVHVVDIFRFSHKRLASDAKSTFGSTKPEHSTNGGPKHPHPTQLNLTPVNRDYKTSRCIVSIHALRNCQFVPRAHHSWTHVVIEGVVEVLPLCGRRPIPFLMRASASPRVARATDANPPPVGDQIRQSRC